LHQDLVASVSDGNDTNENCNLPSPNQFDKDEMAVLVAKDAAADVIHQILIKTGYDDDEDAINKYVDGETGEDNPNLMVDMATQLDQMSLSSDNIGINSLSSINGSALAEDGHWDADVYEPQGQIDDFLDQPCENHGQIDDFLNELCDNPGHSDGSQGYVSHCQSDIGQGHINDEVDGPVQEGDFWDQTEDGPFELKPIEGITSVASVDANYKFVV
jgi:hypothetical protein